MEVRLPHLAPLRFLKKIIYQNENEARTLVSFDDIPSLGMLVESAAQSCSALDSSQKIKSAFLVSMKNVKLLQEPQEHFFEVLVKKKHSLENMKLIDFEVFEQSEVIANGSLTIAIEESK